MMERISYHGNAFGGWHVFSDREPQSPEDFRYAVSDDGELGVGFPRGSIRAHDLPARFTEILRMIAFPHIL